MDVHTNISLKNLTTMHLGGPARFFTEIHTVEELRTAFKNAAERNIPWFVIGDGSNLIARDEGYNGLVLRMRIKGFEVIEDTLYTTTIKVGAGENWDEVVARTVAMRLTGIEAMSAIPGTMGAAPVQNVGAYGQEIAGVLTSLEAYDTTADAIVTLQNADCEFSYRHSIFRGSQQGRYIITSVTITLSKSPLSPPFYEALQKYFDEHSITLFTQQTIRDAVIAIRTDKLPDPAVKPSAGSFFKNALVEEWQYTELQKNYPDIKAYEMGNGMYKIPTGWLIEKLGFKSRLINGIRVNEKNCLVLINESATGYADLAATRDEIINTIRDTFHIQVEQEPLEIVSPDA